MSADIAPLYYELTGETQISSDGDTLHRIRATRDLPLHDVKAGETGGFIESKSNLSGNARVSGDARVFRDEERS